MPKADTALIVDANVLIDYANADITVLALFARVVGPLHVPEAVLDKVAALDRDDCDQIGIRIAEPSLEQLLEAGERRGKRPARPRRSALPHPGARQRVEMHHE